VGSLNRRDRIRNSSGGNLCYAQPPPKSRHELTGTSKLLFTFSFFFFFSPSIRVMHETSIFPAAILFPPRYFPPPGWDCEAENQAFHWVFERLVGAPIATRGAGRGFRSSKTRELATLRMLFRASEKSECMISPKIVYLHISNSAGRPFAIQSIAWLCSIVGPFAFIFLHSQLCIYWNPGFLPWSWRHFAVACVKLG
jgi:hypothetical protein